MKNTNFFTRVILSVLVSGSISMVSCRKEANEMINDSITQEEDEQAEMVSDNADNMSEEAAKGVSSFDGPMDKKDAFGSCAIITVDSMDHSNQDTVTIDFGSGCEGQDGRIRKGKIIVYQTGRRFDAGSVRKTTFENYFINDIKVEGERVVTNKGKNSNGQTYWEVAASNMKMTKPDGKFRSWNSLRTRTITTGEGTKERYDDSFIIEGTANGTNGKGEGFTATITNPLIKSAGCRWINQGTIVFSKSDKPDRTLDFGDGTCDNKAIISVKNKTKTITLSK